MHRSAMLNTIKRQMAFERMISRPAVHHPACDVFINHRGIDTKRSIASLLYLQLTMSGISSFLDNKNMKPGDKLFDHIDHGIMGCKVGVAVFSPRYCESHYCLHELALMRECGKKVIPIFCDVKPSQLRVSDLKILSRSDAKRFTYAIEDAKNTVGIAFDTSKGNWSDVLTDATGLVKEALIEIKNKKKVTRHTRIPY